MDVVEWSRALDIRLSEWCCSVSMVWVQIPSREEQKLTALKSNSNTVWFNFQTYIYIYIRLIWSTRVIRGRSILLNPDNHFTERNMSNLLDSKFSQRKINELLIRFTARNPCFTRYARNVSLSVSASLTVYAIHPQQLDGIELILKEIFGAKWHCAPSSFVFPFFQFLVKCLHFWTLSFKAMYLSYKAMQ